MEGKLHFMFAFQKGWSIPRANDPRQQTSRRYSMVVTLLDWYTANDELLANGRPFSCPPDTKQWQVSRSARNGILKRDLCCLSGD